MSAEMRRGFGGAAICLAFLCVVSSVNAATLVAEEETDAGNTSSAFLARGAGARTVAMGEAGVALGGEVSAVTMNPAGLSGIRSFSVLAEYGIVGAGIGQHHAGVALPVRSSTVAAGFTLLDYGTIDIRDADGVLSYSEALSDWVASAGWAFKGPAWFGERGAIGISAVFVQNTNGHIGYGGSMGVEFAAGQLVDVGLSAQHVGVADNGGQLPSVLKAGGAMRPIGGLTTVADLGYSLVDAQLSVGAGVEYVVGGLFSLRAGYRWRSVNADLGGMAGVRAGLGLRFSSLSLDYAFEPYGDFLTSHRIAVAYVRGRSLARASGVGAH